MNRRRFLKIGVSSGALLTLGAYLGAGGERSGSVRELWRDQPDGLTPNAWVSIGKDDSVTVRIAHSEMGQGVSTALAMLVAEELDADWGGVRVEIAPADAAYKNPAFNCQMTAASTSVKTSWIPLRRAGAAARLMLVAAAAQRWGVPAGECRTENGAVVHDASARRIRYGALVDSAAKLAPPEQVPLKDATRFTLIGRPVRRLDTADKIRGRTVFGIDVRLPGLLHAAVIHPPVLGAQVGGFDAAAVAHMPGVLKVLKMSTGIAVVASTYWQAQTAADALPARWSLEARRAVSSRELHPRWAGLCRGQGAPVYRQGDAAQAIARAPKSISAVYSVPFQAHAAPEPMNCTADVRPDRCDIWVPTQAQDAAREAAARITGLPYDRIGVHTTFVGGGFGRRMTVDYVVEAVEISKAVEAPVKVVWSREEDTRTDVYRPGSHAFLEAAIGPDGLPTAWRHVIVGPDQMAHQLPGMIAGMLPYGVPRAVRNAAAGVARVVLPRVVPGKKACEGAAPLPYDVENVVVEYVHDDPGIPLGFWRSVAFSQNVFFVESFMDEIASATNQDPMALRLALLEHKPRLAQAIRLAGTKAAWGAARPGLHQGLAAYDFHGTSVAMIAEVPARPDRRIQVHRIVCALDCGTVINPGIVKSQIEGGIAFGLTAALKGEITFTEGRVDQGNFDDFPLLRMDEMPVVEVHLVPSGEPPTGIGESAVPPAAPAVANAVFKATGKRVRDLPLRI